MDMKGRFSTECHQMNRIMSGLDPVYNRVCFFKTVHSLLIEQNWLDLKMYDTDYKMMQSLRGLWMSDVLEFGNQCYFCSKQKMN